MRFLSLCTSAHAEVIALAVRLGARRRSSDQNRCSERPTRGHPARLGSRNPTFCSKSVPLGLLQEALRTAALAKRTRDASSMRARLSLCAQRFRGWARVGGHRVSRSLNRRVARLPRWPTGWAESLSGSLAGQGAGLRQVRSRWRGHYPRGRTRWFGPDPLRIVTRG